MMRGNGNSVFPPLTWLMILLQLIAVLLEVIWNFISTDRREQLDGTMYQWISPYGVWCGCMGKIEQFSRNFIVHGEMYSYNVYSVSHSCACACMYISTCSLHIILQPVILQSHSVMGRDNCQQPVTCSQLLLC